MFIITNESLSPDDWQFAYQRLKLYSQHFYRDGNTIYHPVKYSTTKYVFSPDCGARTTEYQSFSFSLSFYLGEHMSGVKVEER